MAGAHLLKVVVVLVEVEGEEDRPCALEEVLPGGQQRAQQGALGKENLEVECHVQVHVLVNKQLFRNSLGKRITEKQKQGEMKLYKAFKHG